MEFFRHCPGCGRRFHIKLVGKQLVREDVEKHRTEEVVSMSDASYLRGVMMPYLTLMEGPPVIVDRREFQYSYKCKHCGHEWSEKHVEEHRES
jgi:DNA-directed RNA polymerase subunit M/transcription elongation factor TFIIS